VNCIFLRVSSSRKFASMTPSLKSVPRSLTFRCRPCSTLFTQCVNAYTHTVHWFAIVRASVRNPFASVSNESRNNNFILANLDLYSFPGAFTIRILSPTANNATNRQTESLADCETISTQPKSTITNRNAAEQRTRVSEPFLLLHSYFVL
jgi:hypothetical protein